MKPVKPPLQTRSTQYNSLSEIRDLVAHIETVAVGLRSGVYQPMDEDLKDLSLQLFSLAQQLRDFNNSKIIAAGGTLALKMY